MDQTISCEPILEDWIWEFALKKQGESSLIFIKAFYVNSLTFLNVDVIGQWNFVIPEQFIVCDDRTKLEKIRTRELSEYKIDIVNGVVIAS